jgi:hypothetical protein
MLFKGLRRRSQAVVIAILAALSIALAAPAGTFASLAARTVDLQLLAINDFHGNLSHRVVRLAA